MRITCERRGQVEIGIVNHNGQIFAAFGASVSGHNVTGYTRLRRGTISLTRWDSSTMLACRSQIVREYHDGSIALLFRLSNGRFIVGFALGDDGMLFRGELLANCDDNEARRKAINLAEYWAEIDDEDEVDPWHGEPEEPDDNYPDW